MTREQWDALTNEQRWERYQRLVQTYDELMSDARLMDEVIAKVPIIAFTEDDEETRWNKAAQVIDRMVSERDWTD